MHLHSLVLPLVTKWCGLPRAANPSILFCGSKSRPDLRLKRIPTVWKQSQASMRQLLKYSMDTRVRSVFKGKLEVEEKCLPGLISVLVVLSLNVLRLQYHTL